MTKKKKKVQMQFDVNRNCVIYR